MAELVDAYVSGAYAERCGGLTPPSRTNSTDESLRVTGVAHFFDLRFQKSNFINHKSIPKIPSPDTNTAENQ